MIAINIDKHGDRFYTYHNCVFDKDKNEVYILEPKDGVEPYILTDWIKADENVFAYWSHIDYNTNGSITVFYRLGETEPWQQITNNKTRKEMCINRLSNDYVTVKYPIADVGYIVKEKNWYDDEKDDYNSGKFVDNRIYFEMFDVERINESKTVVCEYLPAVDYIGVESDMIQFKIQILPASGSGGLKGWDTGKWDIDTYFDPYEFGEYTYIKDIVLYFEDICVENFQQYVPNYYGWF